MSFNLLKSKSWISKHFQQLLFFLWLGIAYFGVAKLSLLFAFSNPSVTTVWPPAGIALAAFLISGRQVWPAIYLGALTANASSGIPLLASLGISAGNTLGAFIGSEVLRRFKNFQPDFSQVEDVFTFIVFGSFIGPIFSASIGVLNFWLVSLVSWETIPRAWLVWWSGDVIGILVVVPFVLILSSIQVRKPCLKESIEALILGAMFSGTTLFALTGSGIQTFLVYPFVVWAAIRFQQLGVATLLIILVCVSMVSIAFKIGPHPCTSDLTLFAMVCRLKLFISTTGITGLLLAADIRSRKLVESRLRESEEQFRLLFEKAPIGVARYDANSVVLNCNHNLAKMLGTDRDQIIGVHLKSTLQNIHQNAALNESLLGRVGVFEGEYTSSAAGKKSFIKTIFSPLFNLDGSLGGGIAVTEDLTLQQKVTESKMAQRIAHLGSFWLDLNTRCVVWSEELYVIFGLNPNGEAPNYEERGKLFSPESWACLNSAVDRVEEVGQSYELELEIRKKDGKKGWLWTFGEPVRDARGTIVAIRGAAQDITERKRVETELLVAKNEAEKAARTKAEFLDIAAHELRNPVAAISLLLQLICKQIENGQEIHPSLVMRLREPTERLSSLIADLLDVSRLERGLIILRKIPTDIISLISKCLEEFKLQAPKRPLLFHKPEYSIEMEIDPVRINQVISNLIDNAIKYTPEETTVEVRVETMPDFIRISVVDQGIGISELHKKYLFMPFARGKNEATIRASGLGLGLTICHEIMKLHHGSIGVVSELNKGSVFYFDLPKNRSAM